ncbi:hypothetical protein [Capnocytophaga stomatis]|uniref:DUF4825 domain-containing protein n=1 Tax=Capnocytophaga stomatis TaxID=1848904 RepID=A0ABW8QB32_9FLAO|nr:hypothetical protein [Capnocytophaga stomatis]GIJ93549.1 hypothetical protein CAPN002_07670 [Capnocytophaga stomatis]GIM50941.1 hypothetical protein CAPN003_23930 [Capnocytophaga stomatis]
MKRIILILLLIFSACTPKNEEPCCANYSIPSIYLLYKDVAGNNLFDPKNENAYKVDEIKVYYQINREEKLLEKATTLIEKNGVYYLGIGNFSQIASRWTAYEVEIMLSPNQEKRDKFKVTISMLDGYTVIDKIWYNGEIVFERKNDTMQDFLEVSILK